MNKSKKWALTLIIFPIFVLVAIGTFTAVIDPYFHYHAPLQGLGYILEDERYQNDGIARHFDYDAMIAGTSMTENFKTSTLDSLFGTHSVKTPFSGGSYYEVNNIIKVGIKNNPKLKTVIRGLDYGRIIEDKNHTDYDPETYPNYLYDDNITNDLSYILNKNALFMALQDVLGFNSEGKLEIDFDKYANWTPYYPIGRDAVNANYDRASLSYVGTQYHLTEEEIITVKENVSQNIVETVEANPDIDFYLFITPYNIYYMDFYYVRGMMLKQLEAERMMIEAIVGYENVHLYSFFTDTELILNIDEFRDIGHYSEKVSEEILRWMKEGKGLITKDNYEAYCSEVYDYYMNADYD
nr:hypothetical protein [Lachnospiraceae bacterium]